MIAITILISLSTWIIVDGCPRAEEIYPCICITDSSDSDNIVCSNIDNEHSIQTAMISLRGKTVYSIKIENSAINFLPHDLFKGLSVEELELESSSFTALSDTDVALIGLEKHLGILTIRDCTFMSAWDWSHLKNMENLFRIDILGGDMDSIGEEITAIAHLPIVDLAFSRNEITWIDDHAFTNYSNLISLSLNENQLEEIKRSMLPDPAISLTLLDLSDNKIIKLPKDIFTNMPSLTDISLNNNQLLTLDENALSPVWEQLELFGALGNPLRCDCRMSWLLKVREPKETFRAVCVDPPKLKGRSINSLLRKELWC